MSAIAAAIVELEAQRERIGTLITELRRHARSIEDSHTPLQTQAPPPAKVKLAIDGREIGRAMAEHLPTAKTASRIPDSPHDAILRALDQAGSPMTRSDLLAATGLSLYHLKRHLPTLIKIRSVVKTGATISTRFARAPLNSVTRASSGSGAGKPAGSAGGPGPGDAQFETVWNGTKERNGDAPSLVPPRERKP